MSRRASDPDDEAPRLDAAGLGRSLRCDVQLIVTLRRRAVGPLGGDLRDPEPLLRLHAGEPRLLDRQLRFAERFAHSRQRSEHERPRILIVVHGCRSLKRWLWRNYLVGVFQLRNSFALISPAASLLRDGADAARLPDPSARVNQALARWSPLPHVGRLPRGEGYARTCGREFIERHGRAGERHQVNS